MNISTKRKLAAVVLPFALFAAACGSDSDDDATTDDAPVTTEAPAADDTTEDTTDEAPADEMAMPEGPGCAAVPPAGEDGSFDAMAQDPVATAASTNPSCPPSSPPSVKPTSSTP